MIETIKSGWVLADQLNNFACKINGKRVYSRILSKMIIFNTRKQARSFKISGEQVKKLTVHVTVE